MAKDFATPFYNSSAWRACRAAYIKKRYGLCEDCLARGDITPGVIVHHIIPITPDNINNPGITLSFSNLRLLCRDCHAAVHADDIRQGHGWERKAIHYTTDDSGHIIAVDRAEDVTN